MQRLLRPVGLLVVAAVVGFGIAREVGGRTRSDPGALDHTGSTPAFSVRYPSRWHGARTPPLIGLALADELAAGPSRTRRLAIGRTRAAAVGTLPARFLASLSARPRPAAVQLGPYRFDRYLDLRPREVTGAVSVYLLATTRSTIVATCSTPARRDRFVGECERVLATLRLRGGAQATNVDTAYAVALSRVLARLNPVRERAGPGLRSPDIPARARAARTLAAAEQTAATAAARLPAGTAAAANRELVGSLRAATSGYRRLATAALDGDTAGYEDAQRTLAQAQSTLADAFRTLAALGYRLR